MVVVWVCYGLRLHSCTPRTFIILFSLACRILSATVGWIVSISNSVACSRSVWPAHLTVPNSFVGPDFAVLESTSINDSNSNRRAGNAAHLMFLFTHLLVVSFTCPTRDSLSHFVAASNICRRFPFIIYAATHFISHRITLICDHQSRPSIRNARFFDITGLAL